MLDETYGPFTVRVWLVLAVVGAAIGLVLRRYSPSAGGGSGAGDAPDYGGALYGGPTWAGGAIDVGAGDADLQSLTDDSQLQADWIKAALAAIGGGGATWNALSKALAGAELNPTEAAIFARAVQAVGPPPVGTPYIVGAVPDPSSGQSRVPQHSRLSYVVTHIGGHYIVSWNTLRRLRVASNDRQVAARIFGGPISSFGQIPDDARRRQRADSRADSATAANQINLGAVLGYVDAGTWIAPTQWTVPA